MRILCDAYWWIDGPPSGRNVCRELIHAWLRVFPGDEVAVAARAADVTTVRKELPESVQIFGARLRPQGLAAILELPWMRRRARADVVLSHNYTPLFGRSATFLHDVLFQTNPEWFTPAERLYFSAMPRLARRAAVVLTSSHTEADRIRRNNPALRNVVPVGLAVGMDLLSAVARRPAQVSAQGRFVLSVGRLNVRKNLAVVLAAALESGAVSPEVPLVVVGERDGRGAGLPVAAMQAIDGGTIRFLGGVSTGELRWLYEHALLLLFLSLDEGFGLPPLEALRFGTPVLVSDIPVFRETLGDRASFVDPHDIGAAAATLRAQVSRAERVVDTDDTYSWDQCVTRIRNSIGQLPAQRQTGQSL
jgi:glycosyltransferase involved in cell wall biosynthesis